MRIYYNVIENKIIWMEINMKRLVCLLLSLFLICTLVGCGNSNEAEIENEPAMVDSGIMFFQTKNDADCALIRHNGKNILVDTGEKKDAKSITKKLLENGIDKIDCIIFSHFDKDHCGGALKIMKEISVSQIIHPKYVKDTEETEELFSFVNENGIEDITIDEHKSIAFDDVSFTFYPAQKYEYFEKTSNNSSLVFKVEFDGKSALFTGDCQDERMSELLESDYDFSADILKLMYHGREVKNEEKLLERINPTHTVITAKSKSKETKENIKNIESYLGEYSYNTDGDIVFDFQTIK